jgi:hypothetical protein
VHPAFRGYLDGIAAALDPVAAEIAGLPGAPVRAEQVPNGDPFYGSRIAGSPPVYEFTVTLDWLNPATISGTDWRTGFQQDYLDDFAGYNPDDFTGLNGQGGLGQAQQAVVSALLTAAGSPASSQAIAFGGPPAPRISAAADRFAALSASARHAWLAAYLTALRAGRITLAQIP